MGQRSSKDAFDPSKSGPARIGQQGTWKPREPVTRAPTVGSARKSVGLTSAVTDTNANTGGTIGIIPGHAPNASDQNKSAWPLPAQGQQASPPPQVPQQHQQLPRQQAEQRRRAQLAALPSHLEGSIEVVPPRMTAFLDTPLRVSDPPDAALRADMNRWSNIFPNYVSQVLLSPWDLTYINASWIRSFSPDKACEYIAAETPSLATLCNFLCMVWNHNVHFLVLLSDIGSPHGQRYWPSTVNQVMEFNGISVTLVESEAKDGYERIGLRLRKPSGETRDTVLYWYRAWPHNSVPHTQEGLMNPRPLVEMMLSVRAERHAFDRRRTPLLVHCDDGIARTGAYVVIDQAMDCVEARDPVDVLSLIARAREDRMAVVPSTQLMRFVFEAALQYAFCFLKSHPEAPGVAYIKSGSRLLQDQLATRFAKHTLENGQDVHVLLSVAQASPTTQQHDQWVLVPRLSEEEGSHSALPGTDPTAPFEMQPFFKSNFSRSQVEDLLKKCADASFLVSSSAIRPGRLLLSCTVSGSVYHTVIEEEFQPDGTCVFLVQGEDNAPPFSTAVDAAAWLVKQVQDTREPHAAPTHLVSHMQELQFDDEDATEA